MRTLTLDTILAPASIRSAWDKVRNNRGAAGEDAVTIGELEGHFDHHWHGVERAIRAGCYSPAPLRPVAIPKPSGGTRKLAIPSVMDRIIQQAIAAAMSERWEPAFPECSFAYRPGLGAGQALNFAMTAAGDYADPIALRFDIKDFFDTVPHTLCSGALAATPCNADLTKLTMLAVAAPLASALGPSPRSCGIPQGSPLSPVMANIILLPFDRQLLTLPGHYLRYADDMMVLCHDQAAAAALLARAEAELAALGLRINGGKTSILPLEQASFLGCGFQFRHGRWVRKLPAATLLACRQHLMRLADSAKPTACLEQFLAQWSAYFLPLPDDRTRHGEFIREMRELFHLGGPSAASQDHAHSPPQANRPPPGFHYDGSHSSEYSQWGKAAWAGRFFLRRIRFGLTFRRRGFLPVPSGLRVTIMGHQFHFRL
ncbi:MAG: reverse transcriptase domain-containing protein [Verrucomicrobia bacterium]|nr:reverse transcriptase domain-containing protein [Verrucomicrobiota bacterium]